MNRDKVDKIIGGIEQIPTLPMMSEQIMKVLGDDTVSMRKAAALIEKDQSLAVRILKVANSSFYGNLSKVSSIDQALVILGLREVRAILAGFSIYRFFSHDRTEGFDRRGFWKHAIVCSQVAKYLARHFHAGNDDTLFLSGLIHDIGKVVLDRYFHEEFMRIIDYVSSRRETFSRAEREVLGVTHYQVAAKLLQQWKFPERVIMKVFYHHAPWHDANHTTGSIILFLANQLTKMAGYSCLESEKPARADQFEDSKAMTFFMKNGFELDPDVIRRLVHEIQEYISSESENTLRLFEG